MIAKVKAIVDKSNPKVKANFKKFVNENHKVLNSKDSKAINEKLNGFLANNNILHDNFEPIQLKTIVKNRSGVYAVLEKYRRENNRLFVEARKIFETINKDGKYHCKKINEKFSILEHKYSHLSRKVNESSDLDLTTGTFGLDSLQEFKDNFDQKFVDKNSDKFDDVALNDFFYSGGSVDLDVKQDSGTISGYTATITLNSPDGNIDKDLERSLSSMAKQYFESTIVDYVAESINEGGEFSDDSYDIYGKAKNLMKPEDIDHHASDLYLKINDISTKLVDEYKYPQNVTKFRSQIDNQMWYDIPFAWYKESVNEGANINVGVIKIKSMDELAKTLGKFFTDHKNELETEELTKFFDYGGYIELDVEEKQGTSTGYGVEPTYTTGANYGYMLDDTTSQNLDRLFDLYYELDATNYPKSVNEDVNLNIGDKVSVFDDNFKYPEYYGIVKSINDDTVNLEIRDKTDRVVNSSFNTTLNGVSEPFGDVNENANEPEIITQLRKIVSDSQYQDLTDSVTGSKMTVDMGSAANMLQIYDNINDTQKTDFVSKGLKGMFDMTNRIFKKFESVNESAYSEVINESSEDDYKQLEQEYQTKKNELFSFGNGWIEGFGNNVSKNYGDEKYIKVLTISTEADFVAHKIYYQVRVGYSKTPNYGAEADKFYSEQNKLSDTQFNTVQDAVAAADKFASDWNNKPINEDDTQDYKGVTIHSKFDTSGGQHTQVWKAPTISDSWYWNLDALKSLIDSQAINEDSSAKIFNIQNNVGKSKYIINYSDGVKTHGDGSRFFDIKICNNIKEKDDFVKQLKDEGYVYSSSINESATEYVDATELVKSKISNWDGKGVLRFDLANPIDDTDKQLFLTTSGRDIADKFNKPYQIMIDGKAVTITDLDNIDKKGNIINESSDEDYIAEYTQKDEKFRYMLLGRMQSDNDYYLGNGGQNDKHLFMGDKNKQIKLMKALHNSFEQKPEWLSMDDIDEYGKKMGVVNEAFKESYDNFIKNFPIKPVGGSDLIAFNSNYEDLSVDDKKKVDDYYKNNKSINEDDNDDQKLTNFYIACSAITNYGYQLPQEIFDEYLTDENVKTLLDSCDKIMKDSDSDSIDDDLSNCIKQQVESIFPRNIILQYT